MKIRVIFPTRGRKEKFNQTFNKYFELQEQRNRYFVIADYNDPQRPEKDNRYQLDVGSSFSKIHAINRGTQYLQDNDWDIVLLASDDMIPQRKGWDTEIVKQMKQHYPDNDGVLWFYDGVRKDLNTLVCMGRKYFERFGFLYNPAYETFYCDNEFMQVATMLGKQVFIDDCIIAHEHIYNSEAFKTTRILDDTAKRNEYYDVDKPIYEARQRTGFDMVNGNYVRPKELHLFNDYHLGDSVFTIKLLRQLLDENPNDKYFYYCKVEYMKELEKHIVPKYGGRIILSNIKTKPATATDTWIGYKNFYQTHEHTKVAYDLFYEDYFRMFCLSINRPIPKSLTLFDYYSTDKKIKHKFDILFINSVGFSSQLENTQIVEKLNVLATQLAAIGISVITTEKINGLPCTRDLGFNLVDIGELSKHCKAIVGVNTSPIVACFNKENRNKYFAIIDQHNNYSFSKNIKTDNDFNEVKERLIELCPVSQKTNINSDELKVMVQLSVYNRANITEICLEQLSKITSKDNIYITNDGSTENGIQDIISKYSNNIITQQNKGIHLARIDQMQAFLKSDYDLLYMTDNDAFLDLSALEVAKLLYKKTGKAVSLYNSDFLLHDTIISNNEIFTKRNCSAGISMLLDKDMVEMVLNTNSDRLRREFDWAICDVLSEFIISNTSYVQHYGADGLHNKTMENDRGLNPSCYLRLMDSIILEKLNNKNNGIK